MEQGIQITAAIVRDRGAYDARFRLVATLAPTATSHPRLVLGSSRSLAERSGPPRSTAAYSPPSRRSPDPIPYLDPPGARVAAFLERINDSTRKPRPGIPRQRLVCAVQRDLRRSELAPLFGRLSRCVARTTRSAKARHPTPVLHGRLTLHGCASLFA
jgi:hypothetical protein